MEEMKLLPPPTSNNMAHLITEWMSSDWNGDDNSSPIPQQIEQKWEEVLLLQNMHQYKNSSQALLSFAVGLFLSLPAILDAGNDVRSIEFINTYLKVDVDRVKWVVLARYVSPDQSVYFVKSIVVRTRLKHPSSSLLRLREDEINIILSDIRNTTSIDINSFGMLTVDVVGSNVVETPFSIRVVRYRLERSLAIEKDTTIENDKMNFVKFYSESNSGSWPSSKSFVERPMMEHVQYPQSFQHELIVYNRPGNILGIVSSYLTEVLIYFGLELDTELVLQTLATIVAMKYVDSVDSQTPMIKPIVRLNTLGALQDVTLLFSEALTTPNAMSEIRNDSYQAMMFRNHAAVLISWTRLPWELAATSLSHSLITLDCHSDRCMWSSDEKSSIRNPGVPVVEILKSLMDSNESESKAELARVAIVELRNNLLLVSPLQKLDAPNLMVTFIAKLMFAGNHAGRFIYDELVRNDVATFFLLRGVKAVVVHVLLQNPKNIRYYDENTSGLFVCNVPILPDLATRVNLIEAVVYIDPFGRIADTTESKLSCITEKFAFGSSIVMDLIPKYIKDDNNVYIPGTIQLFECDENFLSNSIESSDSLMINETKKLVQEITERISNTLNASLMYLYSDAVHSAVTEYFPVIPILLTNSIATGLSIIRLGNMHVLLHTHYETNIAVTKPDYAHNTFQEILRSLQISKSYGGVKSIIPQLMCIIAYNKETSSSVCEDLCVSSNVLDIESRMYVCGDTVANNSELLTAQPNMNNSISRFSKKGTVSKKIKKISFSWSYNVPDKKSTKIHYIHQRLVYADLGVFVPLAPVIAEKNSILYCSYYSCNASAGNFTVMSKYDAIGTKNRGLFTIVLFKSICDKHVANSAILSPLSQSSLPQVFEDAGIIDKVFTAIDDKTTGVIKMQHIDIAAFHRIPGSFEAPYKSPNVIFSDLFVNVQYEQKQYIDTLLMKLENLAKNIPKVSSIFTQVPTVRKTCKTVMLPVAEVFTPSADVSKLVCEYNESPYLYSTVNLLQKSSNKLGRLWPQVPSSTSLLCTHKLNLADKEPKPKNRVLLSGCEKTVGLKWNSNDGERSVILMISDGGAAMLATFPNSSSTVFIVERGQKYILGGPGDDLFILTTSKDTVNGFLDGGLGSGQNMLSMHKYLNSSDEVLYVTEETADIINIAIDVFTYNHDKLKAKNIHHLLGRPVKSDQVFFVPCFMKFIDLHGGSTEKLDKIFFDQKHCEFKTGINITLRQHTEVIHTESRGIFNYNVLNSGNATLVSIKNSQNSFHTFHLSNHALSELKITNEKSAIGMSHRIEVYYKSAKNKSLILAISHDGRHNNITLYTKDCALRQLADRPFIYCVSRSAYKIVNRSNSLSKEFDARTIVFKISQFLFFFTDDKVNITIGGTSGFNRISNEVNTDCALVGSSETNNVYILKTRKAVSDMKITLGTIFIHAPFRKEVEIIDLDIVHQSLEKEGCSMSVHYSHVLNIVNMMVSALCDERIQDVGVILVENAQNDKLPNLKKLKIKIHNKIHSLRKTSKKIVASRKRNVPLPGDPQVVVLDAQYTSYLDETKFIFDRPISAMMGITHKNGDVLISFEYAKNSSYNIEKDRSIDKIVTTNDKKFATSDRQRNMQRKLDIIVRHAWRNDHKEFLLGQSSFKFKNVQVSLKMSQKGVIYFMKDKFLDS